MSKRANKLNRQRITSRATNGAQAFGNARELAQAGVGLINRYFNLAELPDEAVTPLVAMSMSAFATATGQGKTSTKSAAVGMALRAAYFLGRTHGPLPSQTAPAEDDAAGEEESNDASNAEG